MQVAPVKPLYAWVTVLSVMAAGGMTVSSAQAHSGTHTVAYHGYQVEIPQTWEVIDLAEHPGSCIRFDRPAVYLGHPGDRTDCPASLVGRTAGLVVEPLDAISTARTDDFTARARPGTATAPTAPSRNDHIQVAVEDAGVLVTAAHTPATTADVRRVLNSATLTDGALYTPLAPAPQPFHRAEVTAGPQPGNFIGKDFDACAAPSQSTMDTWLARSPYRAVGIYISGTSRTCGQPHLTPAWVGNQTVKGWHLIPIDVGRQAPCSTLGNKMSNNPATARAQGVEAADASTAAAQALGIPVGSALYSDIEGYPSTASCKAAVLSFLTGWTTRLHGKGYLSGVYSSASSGIKDAAAEYNNPAYTRVDHIWFAWWNNATNTNAGSYVPSTAWPNHQRIHQYADDVSETWGGATISIDRNYLDVAESTPGTVTCASTSLSFTAYSTVSAGSNGGLVDATQCLLERADHDPGPDTPTGTFDAATEAAAKSFQRSRGIAADGVIGAKTWTALLSQGATPTLRAGSSGEAVTRLQRSLTAELGRTVGMDGSFGPGTEQAARDYQTSRGLGPDGIVGPGTWLALQAGN
ncbi:glycoside hydrolase domain-containing protein [Streptomyces sp. NPDC051366]|uniref:glycoside hydrolase domain-containing protein n=1 Tax=Streptomyces sp. NPDC051366 TaxID=3365652 RepID=UPI00378F93C8